MEQTFDINPVAKAPANFDIIDQRGVEPERKRV
jgi:hypothetical protein